VPGFDPAAFQAALVFALASPIADKFLEATAMMTGMLIARHHGGEKSDLLVKFNGNDEKNFPVLRIPRAAFGRGSEGHFELVSLHAGIAELDTDGSAKTHLVVWAMELTEDTMAVGLSTLDVFYLLRRSIQEALAGAEGDEVRKWARMTARNGGVN
jgi:hypothetical protein